MITKKKQIIVGAIAGAVAILGILWFYQQQGFIKVFPTREDFEIRRLAKIDETRFSWPEGLTEEQYQEKLTLLRGTRRMILENPKDPVAWFNFGSNLEFLNDHEGAIAAWKKTLENQPQNFPAAHGIATNYQYFLKDYPQAEQYYLQALFAKPDYTPSYQGLADLYIYNYPERRDQLEPVMIRGAADDPANAAAYYSILVETFAEEGNMDKARQYLSEVEKWSADSASRLRERFSQL